MFKISRERIEANLRAELRARADRRGNIQQQLAALETLAAALKAIPLATVQDFRRLNGAEPVISCNTRPGFVDVDLDAVNLLWASHGWTLRADKPSKLLPRYAIYPLIHDATAVRLCLIVGFPPREMAAAA